MEKQSTMKVEGGDNSSYLRCEEESLRKSIEMLLELNYTSNKIPPLAKTLEGRIAE